MDAYFSAFLVVFSLVMLVGIAGAAILLIDLAVDVVKKWRS